MPYEIKGLIFDPAEKAKEKIKSFGPFKTVFLGTADKLDEVLSLQKKVINDRRFWVIATQIGWRQDK